MATADELLSMPDDGYRYELVRGELRRMSPAGYRHGVVAGILHISLGNYVSARRLGLVSAAETGFLLARDPDCVRAPDVSFVGRERLAGKTLPIGFFPGAPDLAVEVVSPGDRFSEVQEKVFDWLDGGCRMVLAVDPEERVVTVYCSRDDVRVLGERDVLNGGDVVPGWSVPVRDLFVG